MQHEDGAKVRAGWVAALAPALKVKPGAFGFMPTWCGRQARMQGPEGTEPRGTICGGANIGIEGGGKYRRAEKHTHKSGTTHARQDGAV